MFNLSGSELVFFVLIALVVLGPDKLPEAMRKAGKAYADFKKMTSGFQSEMRSVLDEPMRELRETAELAKKAASWDTNMLGTKPVSASMADHTPAPKVENPAAAHPVEPAGDAPPAAAAASIAPAAPAAADPTSRRLQAMTVDEPTAVVDEVPVVEAPKPFSPNFSSAAPRVTLPATEIDEVAAE